MRRLVLFPVLMSVFAAAATAATAVSLLVGLGLVPTLFPVTAIAAAMFVALPVCRRTRLAAVAGL